MVTKTSRRRVARFPYYRQSTIIIRLDSSLLGGPLVTVLAIETLFLLANLFFFSATISANVRRVTAVSQPAPIIAVAPAFAPTLTPPPTSVWANAVSHNRCESVASLQIKFGIQAEVLAEPSLNARRINWADTGNGWMSADAKAGRWWHVCNFGWIDVDSVEAVTLADPASSP